MGGGQGRAVDPPRQEAGPAGVHPARQPDMELAVALDRGHAEARLAHLGEQGRGKGADHLHLAPEQGGEPVLRRGRCSASMASNQPARPSFQWAGNALEPQAVLRLRPCHPVEAGPDAVEAALRADHQRGLGEQEGEVRVALGQLDPKVVRSPRLDPLDAGQRPGGGAAAMAGERGHHVGGAQGPSVWKTASVRSEKCQSRAPGAASQPWASSPPSSPVGPISVSVS
jgi:hypothetical protein